MANAQYCCTTVWFVQNILAHAIIQSSVSFPFFSEAFYAQISSIGDEEVMCLMTTEDIAEGEKKAMIPKLSECQSSDVWRRLMLQVDIIDALSNAGWRKSTNFSQKELVIQCFVYDTVICRRHSSIDQFCEGLKTGNLLATIRQYPQIMKELFTTDRPKS